MEAWNQLTTRIEELDALGGAMALLDWDQQTYLPAGSGESRGKQSAALGRIYHERFTAPEVGGWLDTLESGALDRVQAAAVRNARRRYRRATVLPSRLVEDLSHARTAGFAAWMKAREANDFAPYAAPLQRLIDLSREQAERQAAPGQHPYDALLEDYDPGSTIGELRPMFERLGTELNRFLDALAGRPHPTLFDTPLDVEGQRKLSERVLTDLGFDRVHGRLDISEHPFTVGMGTDDVRITTHFHADNFLAALGGTVHECGHAMYEQGLPAQWAGTGLDKAAGMGLHESQSRFWENFIGRSEAFGRYLAPRMHGIWPTLAVSADALYASMNRVERSLIRIFADEATYNLHIIARFELEVAIMEGTLQAIDLPAAWDDAYRRIVGVVAPTAKEGVLQDVHWSGGAFGYFPSYTIGNLYAASFGARIEADLPDIWQRVERGDFAPILAWLREHVHAKGHLDDAPVLFREVVGDRDPVEDLVAHLWRRHGKLYGVERSVQA
ncbi:MAG: carboxypeptidase M32 [Pseudomonadota bacterium]|nr:carboxypeptidase M32 [Pseudomonadota bacterium]